LRQAQALIAPAGAAKTLARCLGALASSRLFAGEPAAAHTRDAEALRIHHAIGER
jgi:hypothetical protein